ncbi:Ppx/GppA phosphatase family protein [Parvularcula sp. LCG005]|uniref:Ppx/GppA phosphatase family protein n=1 Tax=Parvularcula sp. LCG005 TaxID=3078805 RepID=UPI002941EDF9|nr:Ppx/GppA phosphatase family protein [Parvularcula sp. LCG005]WOI54571.1 Ppx/GppA phosphatase family protein [Parvularcula sp. LCG005]
MVARRDWRRKGRRETAPCFAAIDLGTNNCRLLIVTPQSKGFRVVDAFSRIVRLGEGLGSTGRLGDAAMDRTMDALKICADKLAARNIKRLRCIATQACRQASNGPDFLQRIEKEIGLNFDVITPEEEATLSVKGCHDLIDPAAKAVMVFDIGGGSTEISWINTSTDPMTTGAWTSMPYGVVTVAERHGHAEMTRAEFDAIANDVASLVRQTSVPDEIADAFRNGDAHLIGTSGTVTSLAGVHLKLKRYVRRDVDGLWLTAAEAAAVTESLRSAGAVARAEEPCIGEERADLVIPGCAILQGILQAWPTDRIRVGDRGLREGVLIDLIEQWRRR